MPRTVEINCVNTGRRLIRAAGTPIWEILQSLDGELGFHPIAVKVNNEVKSLYYEIYHPKRIEFIGMDDPNGQYVFLRTAAFLVWSAVENIYPGLRFRLLYTISGSFFCRLEGEKAPSDWVEVVNSLKKEIDRLIAADLPIIEVEAERNDVIERFRANGRLDLVSILSGIKDLYLTYYQMGEHIDYYYGPLAKSSREVYLYDLIPMEDGFILRLPWRSKPDELTPLVPQPKMAEVFNEYVRWNELMDTATIGALNQASEKSNHNDLIKIAEALQEKKIARIADTIASQPEKRLVLIAGPSSSGKTTFSKRLSVQLSAIGLHPIALSLDDYYVERELSPLDENGEYDYESLYALDLDLFNRQLKDLLDGKSVNIPSYNFPEGKKEFHPDRVITLHEGDILIMEGIHALNPELVPEIPQEQQFKIYASALTSILLDDHNRINTTDNRLLRRIIRDSQYRGSSAQATLARWPSVRAGENKWIFPYQENADIIFNSALVFELPVIKSYVVPCLQAVPQSCPEYAEAQRLLFFLKFLTPINDWEIPPTSLLREFVGGSSFKY